MYESVAQVEGWRQGGRDGLDVGGGEAGVVRLQGNTQLGPVTELPLLTGGLG